MSTAAAAAAAAPPLRVGRVGRRPTRQGTIWLLLLVVLLAVGIGKNINLLALLGYAMLAVLGLSAVLVGRRFSGLEAQRFLGEEYHAGALARLEVRLRNTAAGSCSGVCLEEVGLDHACGWYFDQLPAGARQSSSVEVVLPRRGWYDFAPLTAASTYPFGLVRYRRVIGLSARVLVLPRLGRLLRERLQTHLRGSSPQPERPQSRGWQHHLAQTEFHGLRPYRSGDSPRWIHWRTSARRGQLVVREFEDLPGDDLVLVLDPRAATAEQFEDAVSLAATLARDWCQRRGDQLVLFVPATRSLPAEVLSGPTGPEHGRRLLERLAVLVAADADDPADLAALAAGSRPAGAVVVVSAGASDLPARLEAALARPVMHLDVACQQEWGFYTPP